jgi:hypothetical protein
MGDFIKNLPTDNTVITANEMNVMNNVFQENKKTLKTLYSGTKDIIIAGILFFIFTLPFIDSCLGYCLNFVNTSPLMMNLTKSIIFMVILFFCQNFFLSRNVS